MLRNKDSLWNKSVITKHRGLKKLSQQTHYPSIGKWKNDEEINYKTIAKNIISCSGFVMWLCIFYVKGLKYAKIMRVCKNDGSVSFPSSFSINFLHSVFSLLLLKVIRQLT